jgi:hypothetical protein
LGSTELSFVQFTGAGQIIAGAGLTKTGNTIDVGEGEGIKVNVDDVAVDFTVVPNLTGNNTFTGDNIFQGGISGTLLQNESGNSLFVEGDAILIDSSSGDQIVFSVNTSSLGDLLTGTFAVATASYITVNSEPNLPNERSLTSSAGITITDNGANSTIEVGIDFNIIPSLTGNNTFTGDNIFQGGLSGTLLNNENGNSLFVEGDSILIDSSSGDQIILSVNTSSLANDFAPIDANYVLIGNTASLPNERALTSSAGIIITDNGANSTVEVGVDFSIVPSLTGNNTFTGDNIFQGGLSGTILNNENGNSLFVEGDAILIDSSSGDQIIFSVNTSSLADLLTGTFAVATASYVTINSEPNLPNERQLTSSAGIIITDNGANSTVEVGVDFTIIPSLTGNNTFTGDNIFQGGLSGTILNNENGNSLFVEGDAILIDSSSGDQIIFSVNTASLGDLLTGTFAVATASYVTINSEPNLPNERQLTSSAGITITDNGANSTVEIGIDSGSLITFDRFVFNEVPGGSIPGFTFTTANPILTGTLRVYRRGLRLKEGGSDDYTLSGTTITLARLLGPFANFLVDYIKE